MDVRQIFKGEPVQASKDVLQGKASHPPRWAGGTPAHRAAGIQSFMGKEVATDRRAGAVLLMKGQAWRSGFTSTPESGLATKTISRCSPARMPRTNGSPSTIRKVVAFEYEANE